MPRGNLTDQNTVNGLEGDGCGGKKIKEGLMQYLYTVILIDLRKLRTHSKSRRDMVQPSLKSGRKNGTDVGTIRMKRESDQKKRLGMQGLMGKET
jgi:hypothetical protein